MEGFQLAHGKEKFITLISEIYGLQNTTYGLHFIASGGAFPRNSRKLWIPVKTCEWIFLRICPKVSLWVHIEPCNLFSDACYSFVSGDKMAASARECPYGANTRTAWAIPRTTRNGAQLF